LALTGRNPVKVPRNNAYGYPNKANPIPATIPVMVAVTKCPKKYTL
jgi:hypothetical protein